MRLAEFEATAREGIALNKAVPWRQRPVLINPEALATLCRVARAAVAFVAADEDDQGNEIAELCAVVIDSGLLDE